MIEHDVDPSTLASAIERAFHAVEDRPADADATARHVFDALHAGGLQPVQFDESAPPHSGGTHLDDTIAAAIERAIEHGGPVADIALALQRAAGRLAWARRAGFEPGSSRFADGHLDTKLLRFEDDRRSIVVGASVMVPELRYPDHHHPPSEVYVVLSPGHWNQQGGTWQEPGVGGIVYNPPDVVHAMRSDDAPLLAVWLQVQDRDSTATS